MAFPRIWHSTMFWRLRHRLAPINLPFAPSITDVREWKVECLPPSFHIPKPFPSNGIVKERLHRLLIEVGIANTPATCAWDPRSWYALYRYGSEFSDSAPKLKFYAGAERKDPAIKEAAGEEMGTGLTCYILREYFDLTHITDAWECINNGEATYVDPDSKIRPDYFCEDAAGQCVIAESKGSTFTRGRIARIIQGKGWKQVQNIRPVNLPLRKSCGRVVIGTHFCIEGMHDRWETTSLIKDPEGLDSEFRNPDSDMVMRLSYAKCLRFMGQDALAERLILRLPMGIPEPVELLGRFQLRGITLIPLGVSPFGDVICFESKTLMALFAGSETSVKGPVNDSLRSFQNTRNELGELSYSLPNGVIVSQDPEILEEQM